MPVLVGLSRERLLASVLDVPAHVLVLAFVVGDVLDVWRGVVAPTLTDVTGVGFAGPFLATIPGTDTYTDDLDRGSSGASNDGDVLVVRRAYPASMRARTTDVIRGRRPPR